MQAGRVIKFRAWDSERGKMVFPMVMNWWQDEGAPAFKSEFVDCDASHECTSKYLFEVDLMQFTGLRDKNGKEIYEGDVVRFIDVGVIGSQHYKNEGEPKGVVRWSDFGAFYLDDGDEGPFMHSMTEFEVIGNVYENPELLEVDK
jgi:uncharacterized phage protein (TIGR01671 family)